MQSPVRSALVLGLMLAFGATDADAWGRKKKEEAAAAPVAAPVAKPTPPPPPPPPPQWIFPGDPAVAPHIAQTDLMQTAPSEVQQAARWVATSRDNGGMPFMLVDKPSAQVYVFNTIGQLVAVAPVLLGMGKGDQMLVPNTAPMSAIPPHKRITPAGRFLSRLAFDTAGKEILVLDYDAALSIHPIVKGQPAEQRAKRIASATPDDNRVSFGCINVPVAFYSTVISATLQNKYGVVYILPESRTAAEYFGFQPEPVAAPTAPQISATAGAAAGQATTPPAAGTAD